MRINIPKPCHADWESMKIGLVSRHCLQCQKNVIDFRNHKREDIILYLLTNNQEEVCGRFNREQLDHVRLEEIIRPESLKKLPRQKAFAILILASTVLASCQISSTDLSPKPTQDTIEAIDSSESMSQIDSLDRQSDSLTLHAPDPFVDTMDAPLTGVIEIMGEVAVEQTIWEDTVSAPTFDSLESEETSEEKEPLSFAEKMPEFPGGVDELYQYLTSNIRYPKPLADSGIKGKVYARFVVERDGSIGDIEIMRGIGPELFEDEVKRVVKNMPNWIPGENKGKKERVYVILPFVFELPS